jgi:hypothetical protein
MLHRVDVVFYLDAGTGSMLVQLAVAGAAGAAVTAKMGWAKVTSPFRRRNGEGPAADDTDGEQAPQPPSDS